MTARDERLEAAVKALREQGYDGPTAYRNAAAGIIVYDAVRAFEVKRFLDAPYQTPAASPVGGDYVGWRCGKCDAPIAGRFSVCKCGHGPEALDRQSVDQDPRSTAVGADPPWLNDLEIKIDALLCEYATNKRWNYTKDLIRAVLSFAAAQPPSEGEIEAAHKAFHAKNNIGKGFEAMQDALLAAARVRAGG